jgi:hypothetical protein
VLSVVSLSVASGEMPVRDRKCPIPRNFIVFHKYIEKAVNCFFDSGRPNSRLRRPFQVLTGPSKGQILVKLVAVRDISCLSVIRRQHHLKRYFIPSAALQPYVPVPIN